MKVSRYNYPAQLEGDVDDLVQRVGHMLVLGPYILTEHVQEFERSFADYLEARYAVGVNSGTDALILILLALGVGAGDEVITQANTFHATVAAICLCGAKPLLVDVDPVSWQMDVAQVESAITPRTRAIIPVHLYGLPAPMQPLIDIAARHRLEIIEDAAQAHGAKVAGRRVGTWGHAAGFSFHPSKNLAAAGDAGAIVTDDDGLADRLCQLRALGQRSPNNHVQIGLNSKLNPIQALVLSQKLPRLDLWNEQRRQIATAYTKQLQDLPLKFPRVSADAEPVYHLFPLQTERRNELLAHLQEHYVDAVVRYPQAIHCQPAFANFGWRPGQFPVAEQLADQHLCLPIRPDMSAAELAYVADCVGSCFAAGRRRSRGTN
jgi:dTDP-4-amino-4,6-dideoxygalactose transaminase